MVGTSGGRCRSRLQWRRTASEIPKKSLERTVTGQRRGATRTFVLLAMVAFGMLFWTSGSANAAGCTTTWQGDISGDWYGGVNTVNTNWSDNSFPDTNDHACLTSAGLVQPITLNSSATVNHYSVASDATLVVNGGALRALADSNNAG